MLKMQKHLLSLVSLCIFLGSFFWLMELNFGFAAFVRDMKGIEMLLAVRLESERKNDQNRSAFGLLKSWNVLILWKG